ncbi:C39 family peptidase [Helicobacter turcicus]|uniref:Peptidase C39 n=1 Tax=Helicobacter turcicus TaxID=2867412 RepID=A0ABS7JM82_9HELI|nr:cysteine peptidase family C39 domain-containing protein [Helicobacter turcicus]MBX7490502.1 peptidase C39 [Helicobacter turcicus]MBX7545362.1 peptidase C39 [Helicobacter turcicus]
MAEILKILLIFFIAPSLKADFIVKSYQELKNQSVVRQTYEQSCGASSLATLINLIDSQKLSELDLLNIMNEKELYTDMVSFADLERAVMRLNFKSDSFRIDRLVLNKLTNIPLLVKIENDPRYPHFVVIINYWGDFIKVFDPNFGEYISTKKEFFSVWDKDNQGGYVLVVVPKKEFKGFDFNLPKKLDFEKRVFGRF